MSRNYIFSHCFGSTKLITTAQDLVAGQIWAYSSGPFAFRALLGVPWPIVANLLVTSPVADDGIQHPHPGLMKSLGNCHGLPKL